jgi:NADH:ubiquinone oxidoreductase subunit 6 (subunit J)
MKIFIGILGYVLLIICLLLLNFEFIALLAIPVCLVGIVLIIIFYIGLLDKQKPHVKIYSALIGSNILCLSISSFFVQICKLPY